MTRPSETWLQAEEFAYPSGAQTRRGAARFADGRVRRVWGGIPNTFFTIPAHARVRRRYVRGFLTHGEDGWKFNEFNEATP